MSDQAGVQARAALGARVRALRNRAGLSQEEFGALVGRTQSWVSDLERGVAGWPDPDVLRALADALGTDTKDLLTSAGYLDEKRECGAEPEQPSAVQVFTMAMEGVRRGDFTAEEQEAIESALRLAISIHRQRHRGRN